MSFGTCNARYIYMRGSIETEAGDLVKCVGHKVHETLGSSGSKSSDCDLLGCDTV
jgi:hypothetical protein